MIYTTTTKYQYNSKFICFEIVKINYDNNQLKEVELDTNGNKAYYVYDSSGERVRKIIEKGRIREERFYLGISSLSEIQKYKI